MKWLKKLGLTLIAACLLCIPAWAETGDVVVSDPAGSVLDGVASYTATVSNNSTQEKNPVMILVWYENSVLQDMQVSSCSLAAEESTALSVSMSDVEVTDVTKITGFIWEDKVSAVPIAVEEIERFGNSSTRIESFQVAGVDDSRIQVDNENNRIELMIPLYQYDGSTVDTLIFDTTVVTESAKTSVKIGDVTLDGTGVEKKAAVDYGNGGSVIVTAEEGNSQEYTLVAGRYLYEDFDANSVFSDEMLIGSGEQSGVWQSGTTTLVQGDASQYFTTRWDGASGEYGECVSIGVLPVTEAHQRDGSVMSVGESGASGSAIRVSKTKGAGNDSGNSIPYFQVRGSAFREASEEVVIEYDLAMDYTRVTQGNAGCLGGGVRYFRNDTQYNLFDNSNISTSNLSNVGNLAITQGGTLFTANGDAGKPDCPPDAWYHVKTVISMPEMTAVTYINGMQLAAPFDVSGLWTSDLLVSFQSSGFRSLDIWIDNLYVSYK